MGTFDTVERTYECTPGRSIPFRHRHLVRLARDRCHVGHGSCSGAGREPTRPPRTLEDPIRTFVVSLIGAAAVATGLLLIRQNRLGEYARREVPSGESLPGMISLERMRELGY